MAGVFISYSRTDQDFVLRLAGALEARGINVSRDVDDLLPAEEWREQLEQLIAAADTVIFVISPESVSSEVCAWEIELVEKLHKRLAPVVYRDAPNDRVPAGISRLHYVHFTAGHDFEGAVERLVTAINSDIEWLREHTRIGELSRRWDASGRPRSEVLRGATLAAAERWLAVQPKAAPAPTSLHRELISESRRRATRRQQYWIGGSLSVAAIAATLAIFAYLQKGEAERQRTAAERNERQAIANEQRALENGKRASDNEARALAQQRLAEEQREAAQNNLAGQSALLAQLSEEQALAGDGERSINLALSALPRDLANPDRPLVERALSALHFAVDQDRKYMTLAGHANSVMFGAFSHDGTRIVTTSSDKTARLWDAGSGDLIRELAGHDDVVMHAAFSGTGDKLVTTSGPLARVWNAKTGEPLFTLTGHKKNIQQIVFTPDNRRIVTGAWDNTVRIWDAGSGEPLRVLEGPAWLEGTATAGFGVADPIVQAVTKATHQIFGSMQLVAVSPDGKYVATAGRVDPEAAVRLWEIETGKLRRSLTGISMAMDFLFNDISFSPDGTRLVAASGDNTARVWNTSTGEQVLVLRDHDKQVNSARFSFDGRRVVTGSLDASARIWDAATGRVIAALHGHRDQIYEAQFSPDGSLVLTVSSDKTARLWNGTNGALVANLIGHQDRVLSGGFGPDGRHLLTTSRDGSAIVWLAQVGRPTRMFEPSPDVETERYESYHHERPVQVSDGKDRLFVGTTHLGRVGHLVNGATGAVIASIEGQSGVFVDQGRALLTAARGGSNLRLWNAANGGLIKPLPGVALDLHVTSATLVSALGATVHVSDLKAATSLATLEVEDDEVSHAALTSGGRRVIVAGDTSISLWDGMEGRLIRHLDGPTGETAKLVIPPTEDRAAAIGKLGGIGLWRLEDGQAIGLEHDPQEEFIDLAFSDDGRLLLGVRRDGGTHLWRADDGHTILSLARRRLAGATVTDEEFVRLTPGGARPRGIDHLLERSRPDRFYGNDQILSEFAGGALVLASRKGVVWRVGYAGVDKISVQDAAGADPERCPSEVDGVDISPNGRYLVVRSSEPAAAHCIFDVARGTVLGLERSASRLRNAPQFDRDERRLLATGETDDTIWDTATGKVVAEWKRERKDSPSFQRDDSDASLDPTGSRLLTVTEGTAALWDTASRQLLATLRRRASRAVNARFDENGQFVVTYQDDGEVALWRASDGVLIGTVTHPDFQRGARKRSSDPIGQARLLRGSLVVDGDGRVWDLAAGQVVEENAIGWDVEGNRLLVVKKDDKRSSAEPTMVRVLEAETRNVLVGLDLSKDGNSSRAEPDKGPFVAATAGIAATIDRDHAVRAWNLHDGSLATTLSAHIGAIVTAAFNAKGDRIATATDDGQIGVWELPGGKLIASFEASGASPARLLFSPAADKLAVLLGDGSHAVWDAATWQQVTLTDPRLQETQAVSFSPDGTRLLARSYRNAKLWDTKAGALLVDIAFDEYRSESVGFARGGQFVQASSWSQGLGLWSATSGQPVEAADGEKRLAVSAQAVAVETSDPAIVVREIGTGRAILRIADLPASVKSAVFSPDGERLALLPKNGAIVLQGLGGGQPVVVDVPWTSPELVFSPDRGRILIHGAGSSALLVDAGTGRVVAQLSGHVGGVKKAFFSQSGRYAITSTEQGTRTVWDAATGSRAGSVKAESYANEVEFAETTAGLRAVVPTYAAPELWDPLAAEKLGSLKPPEADDGVDRGDESRLGRSERAVLAALGPDGNRLAVKFGGTLECRDVATGRPSGSAKGAGDSVKLAFVGSDRIAALTGKGVVRLWDAATCKHVADLAHSFSQFGAIVPAPDGRTLLTLLEESSSRRSVAQDPYLWDAESGRRVAVLSGHNGRVRVARYSPNGGLILTAAQWGYFILWDATSGRRLRSAGGHKEEIALAEFSPDGETVASTADDGTIHLTDVATGKTAGALRSTGAAVTSLAYSRDGKHLAFGTTAGSIIVADVATRQTLIERHAVAKQIRQIVFVGEGHDILVLDQDGAGQMIQLAPGTFDARPTWQDLVDYASIFDPAGLNAEGRAAADTRSGRPAETTASALEQCDRAASDPSDDKRVDPPVVDAQLRAAEAVEACRRALAEHPDEPRLRHQLARALRAAGNGEEADRLTRAAAEAGYPAAKLACALTLLAQGVQDSKRTAEAEKWLESASRDGSVEALNILGLMRWHSASNDEQRGAALRLLRESAARGSPLAHENLATILSFWPDDPVARSQRLYHLLIAARLHAHIGNAERARHLLITSQVLVRSLRHDVAAVSARRARLDSKMR